MDKILSKIQEETEKTIQILMPEAREDIGFEVHFKKERRTLFDPSTGRRHNIELNPSNLWSKETHYDLITFKFYDDNVRQLYVDYLVYIIKIDSRDRYSENKGISHADKTGGDFSSFPVISCACIPPDRLANILEGNNIRNSPQRYLAAKQAIPVGSNFFRRPGAYRDSTRTISTRNEISSCTARN